MEKSGIGKKPIIIDTNKKGRKPKIVVENTKKIFDIKLDSKYIITILLLSTLIVLFLGAMLYKPSIDKIKESVVMVEVYDNNELVATGSGFCGIKSNYIITNFHVIQGADDIKIVTNDGKKYSAYSVAISNPTEDIAILETTAYLKPLKFGRTKKLKSGSKITAIGSPLGELNTVSTGIISNASNNKGIQLTASISHGSSGGALLNSKNQVIGVTYASLSEGQNLNYAISINYVKEMYNMYKSNRFVTLYTADENECTNNLSSISSTLNFEKCYSKLISYYYAFPSIDTLGQITSEKNIFSRSMKLDANYKLLNTNEKEEAYIYFKALPTERKNLTDSNVNNLDMIEVIFALSDIKKSDIAVGLAGMENRTEKWQFVNSMSLNVHDKIMLLLGYGGYTPSKLNTEDNKRFIKFINEKNFSILLKEKILTRFGYQVRDGRVYY